jgi:EAL domain-containing protein (putative c-di-GMP-specific phosphodiesterase class I)
MAASYGRLEGVGFLFTSIANLATGVVVGVEVLPRPRYPEFADVLAGAARCARRTELDVGLAAAGLRWSLEAGIRLPVHINLLADTVAGPPDKLDEFYAALAQTRGKPVEVVIEISTCPDVPASLEDVLVGARRLRGHGCRLLIDGATDSDQTRSLITELVPEQVKLHPELIRGLDQDRGNDAVTEVVRLCRRVGSEVVADGIDTWSQLEALRGHGVCRGQGALLAVPSRRPQMQLTLAPAKAPNGTAPKALSSIRTPAAPAIETIARFAGAATTVSVEATGEEVRDIFRDAPNVTAVVLVDAARRPVATLDRNRFMLAVSGPYGHALHARRPVRAMADSPRALPASADPRQALDLLAHGDPVRRNDDIIIVNERGHCVGIAHIADVLRGIAELEYERALALHPATRLGGLAVLGRALARRIAGPDSFAVGWLVPDLGPLVERHGFRAEQAALRALAQSVSTAANTDPRFDVAHVLDGLVVITRSDRVLTLDWSIREGLRQQDGPALYSAWVTCCPGQLVQPSDIDAHLVRVLKQAKTLGPGTALTATPDSEPPRRLYQYSAIWDNPA